MRLIDDFDQPLIVHLFQERQEFVLALLRFDLILVK